jgi:hypothetical protein
VNYKAIGCEGFSEKNDASKDNKRNIIHERSENGKYDKLGNRVLGRIHLIRVVLIESVSTIFFG